MSSLPKTFMTPTEYLAFERAAERKHEYFAGEVFAMGGATEQHVLIVTNLVSELRNQLKGKPCKVYSTDMRVKVDESGLYTYPDVVVICGESRFDDDQHDTLLNPTVIIEVLSHSTESYDRGAKFSHYRKIASLVEYVLISQDKYLVEQYVRQPNDQWMLSDAGNIAHQIELPSIHCQLPLAEIYDKVEIQE